jgi:hypothetical protein
MRFRQASHPKPMISEASGPVPAKESISSSKFFGPKIRDEITPNWISTASTSTRVSASDTGDTAQFGFGLIEILFLLSIQRLILP